jgi:hypothetical protein
LNPVQQSNLVVFLREVLTDPRVAKREAPFDRPSLYSEDVMVPTIEAAAAPGAAGSRPSPSRSSHRSPATRRSRSGSTVRWAARTPCW